MFDIQREELDWCGRKLVLETGRIARQADGAVLATWGETTVLATVVAEKQAKPGQDFFPLTVHYQEKTFAAGRIPGGYLKREGRPSERETLTSRLIDRPIRPLFPDEFRCETQIIATVLSYDLESDCDILALVASSAALFGKLQQVTAVHLGLNPVLTTSANLFGGVMGKLISPQSIAVACAAVGLVGKETDIFRKTLKYSMILLVIVILALVGALPSWPHSRSWGYGPSGGLGLVLVIVIVLLLVGRL